jgi:hypothetical protein
MVIAGLCALAPNGRAQSSDQNLPTPVLNNEITGKIKPLDLGDPRLTRHFYAFEGSPGDLLITIDSKNLNGDIDVFTAVTFRPDEDDCLCVFAITRSRCRNLPADASNFDSAR